MNYEILDDLWEFGSDRAYILIALARSKDNEDIRATDQPTIRKVVEDRDELERKIEELSHATKRFEHKYRLYGTVNARNTRDALFNFQHEMTNWLRKADMGDVDVRKNFKRIDHEWKSKLHQESCRDDKYFLFDLDDADEIDLYNMTQELERQDHAQILAQQESPNGWHVITTPFNYNELDVSTVDYELKKDAMVFLGFL